MNINKLLLLATGVIGFASASVNAASILDDRTWLLGFEASGGTGASQNVIINLGTADVIQAAFAGGPVTLNLSASNSVLSTTYGTNWWTRSNLFWGLVGSDNTTYQSWLGTVGSIGTAPLDGTSLVTVNSGFANVQLAATSGNATITSANDSLSVSHDISVSPVSNSGSWQTLVASPAYGSLFSGAGDAPVNTTTRMNVYSFTADTTGIGGADPTFAAFTPTLAGVIGLNNGVISVVPEPSTYALLGVSGVLGLVYLRRRQKA